MRRILMAASCCSLAHPAASFRGGGVLRCHHRSRYPQQGGGVAGHSSSSVARSAGFRPNAAGDGIEGDDGDASAFASKDGGAILGETLDVDLDGGTYSWSNPDADVARRRRCAPVGTEATPRGGRTPGVRRYERLRFDGCGSILLCHPPPRPEAKMATNVTAVGGDRTGASLWSASRVISNYIDAQWSEGGSWCMQEGGGGDGSTGGNGGDVGCENRKRWTVVELGAGLGLCSAVAAKHGMDVVATDGHEDVLDLLGGNLRRNLPVCPNDDDAVGQEVHVGALDWTSAAELDAEAERRHPVLGRIERLGGADVVLLSDVVYGATRPAWDALLALLNRLRDQRRRARLRSNVGNAPEETSDLSPIPAVVADDPIVLLGYTQRRRDMSAEDEARFFALAKAAGMGATLIPSARIPHGEKYMLTSLFELNWS